MIYQVEIRPEALKDLDDLDINIGKRILRKLDWLRANFSYITPEPLKGEFKGLYKLRLGDYRILYTYDNEKNIISVHYIGHRREIYKQAV